MREIDLIPPEHAAQRRLRRWLWRAELALVVLLLATLSARALIELGRARERPVVVRLEQGERHAAAQRTELAARSTERNALQARVALLQRLQERSDWLQALQDVDAAFGRGLWLDQLSFVHSVLTLPGAAASAEGVASPASIEVRRTLEIRGHARDHAAVTGFTRALAEQPRLQAVRLTDTALRRYSFAEVVDFTLSARLAEATKVQP